MGFIYLITNTINGKYYVGQTVNSIQTRWSQHKCEAKRGIPDVYFIRALKKYGPENFIVEELEECADELLNEREIYYIKKYDSNNNNKGYNSTIGGEGNFKIRSEDVKELWDKGFLLKEIGNKLGCSAITVKERLKNYNITDAEIKKRASTINGETKKKKILQYDLSGNLINTFSCVEEAVKQTGYSETAIRSACNHIINMCHNYIWCHEDESKPIQQLIDELPLAKTKRPISQYTLDGDLIKNFNSCADAAKELSVHRVTIEQALKNKAFQAAGFLWKYQDDTEDIIEKVIRNKNKKNYMKKKINQFDLQGNFLMSFDSAKEAAEKLNKPQGSSSIIKACKGKLKTAYGYKWSYANVDA